MESLSFTQNTLPTNTAGMCIRRDSRQLKSDSLRGNIHLGVFSRVHGTKKNFDEVDYLFEMIYDDEYTDVINGTQVAKEQLRKVHERHLSLGSRASIVHFERGLGSVFVNYRLSNDKNDMFIQSSVAIESNKYKRARTLDESFGKFLGKRKQ